MLFCNGLCSDPEEGQVIIQSNSDMSAIQFQNSGKNLNDNASYIKAKKSKYDFYIKRCINSNEPFTDKDFPPNQQSLHYKVLGRKIVWQRIPEVIQDCVMVENDIDASDIQQGNIGDCYFLAAISALAEKKQRIRLIFDNNLKLNKYGIYKIIVNHQGLPRQLVFDDYIPVFAETNRPVFCRANGRQIWVMLLEKAWAKMRGSYSKIANGFPHEVLNTFSVAPVFYTQIHNELQKWQTDRIWSNLIQATKYVLPVCAGSNSTVSIGGIKQNHTYTILGSFNVKSGHIVERLVKLRNPWGNLEYTGYASEEDKQFWSQVDLPTKNKICTSIGIDNGQFLLPFDIFLKNFNSIDICHQQQDCSYNYWNYKLGQHQQCYFQVTFEEQGNVYFTIQKSFQDQPEETPLHNFLNYGHTRLVLARENGGYQYVGSKLQAHFPDLTFQTYISKGTYILMVESSFPNQSNPFSSTLSIYSKIKIKNRRIQQIKPIPNFLEEVFSFHAHRINQSKRSIGPLKGDWIVSQLLYDEGGYGYITCNLQQHTSIRVLMVLDFKTISQSGFEVCSTAQSENILEKGGSKTFVFMVNLKETSVKQRLEFPPAGFRLSRLL